MECERPIPRDSQCGGEPGAVPERRDIGRARAEGDALLDAADAILASLPPVEADVYLEQGRQSGGE
jgi:hypothetical protein